MMLKNSPYIHLLYHDCIIRNYYSKIITCDQNLENKLKPFSSTSIECSNVVHNFCGICCWNSQEIFWKYTQMYGNILKRNVRFRIIFKSLIQSPMARFIRQPNTYLVTQTHTHDKMLVLSLNKNLYSYH